MSFDVSVFLLRSSMLSIDLWNQALDDAGFPLRIIEDDLNIDQRSGWLSCRIQGELGGFHLYSRRVDNRTRVEFSDPEGFDFAVMFSCPSDEFSFPSLIFASSSLCRTVNGILDDPQLGERVAADGCLAWAERLLTGFHIDLATERAHRPS